jgi:SAM-dependent methyltransferase
MSETNLVIPVSAAPVKARGSARRLARRLARAPVFRLLAPGWPDAGRRIVQTPTLEALLARATANAPPTIALNAGVGEGLYSPMLRRFAPNALLLEFDFAVPRKSTDLRACRFSASLAAIPLPRGSVDLAICTEVLEHVADDQSAVAELRRVLAPGGSLVLSVPTPPAVYDPAHVREGYTLAQLSALFEAQGLTIVEARYCMHYCFQAVLTYWRPGRVPLGVILGLAWLDRVARLGSPMDLVVLARPRT